MQQADAASGRGRWAWLAVVVLLVAACAVAVVRAATALGARLAAPGEFTRRAVQNGRLDLTRAEALLDIVEARTEAGLELAHAQRRGRVATAVAKLARAIEALLARVEADLDFPEEEDAASLDTSVVRQALVALLEQAGALSATYPVGRVLRDGFRVALVGPPNAGKSTLFNALLGAERAIVTSRPGTTRDYLEEATEVDGVPLVLFDTAGAREARDEAERAGVERTWQVLESADLVVTVLDAARVLDEGDLELLAALRDRRVQIVLTKGDLPRQCVPGELPPPFAAPAALVVSGKTGEGLDELRRRLRDHALPAGMPAARQAVLSHLRHREALDRAESGLRRALRASEQGRPAELLVADLHGARRALGEIVGDFTTDDLLDTIFSQFCIGK